MCKIRFLDFCWECGAVALTSPLAPAGLSLPPCPLPASSRLPGGALVGSQGEPVSGLGTRPGWRQLTDRWREGPCTGRACGREPQCPGVRLPSCQSPWVSPAGPAPTLPWRWVGGRLDSRCAACSWLPFAKHRPPDLLSGVHASQLVCSLQ